MLLDMMATLVPNVRPSAFLTGPSTVPTMYAAHVCTGDKNSIANIKCCTYYLKRRILNDCTISHDQTKKKGSREKITMHMS